MIVQISDNIFWGFNLYFNENNFSSFEELIVYVKKELVLFLTANNLLNLKELAYQLNLHNHEFESYEKMKKENKEIIYLCGHCKEKV